LASGIAPISKYVDCGINVAIGTDGPASNNCLNMFKEMSLLSGLQKLSNSDPRKAPAYEVLKMATVGGARAMNLLDADILEVGKKADLIEIDLNRPSMQPINNIINNIVYAGDKDIIKMTMINGRILYDSGNFFVGEEISEIYRKCQEVTDRIDQEVINANK
jgi:5-methylthioadenosine/S-adenosylhomocysteine deaminase